MKARPVLRGRRAALLVLAFLAGGCAGQGIIGNDGARGSRDRGQG